MAAPERVRDLSTPDYPAWVHEDSDGFRILVTQSKFIPLHIWQRAYDEGVALVAVPGAAIATDDFIETRVEHPAQAMFEVVGGHEGLSEVPSYREYLASAPSEQEIEKDPLDGTEFVHLHTHTEYSALDGLTTMKELFEQVQAQGGGAVGTADHGNCAGHPDQQAMADKYGIKPIFGMEAYFVPDRFRRSRSWVELDGVEVDPEHLTDAEKKRVERKNDAQQVKDEYTHLTLWAMDQDGLRNLWAMSTEAYRDGLYDGKPRLDWDTLTRHAEGIIVGTGCLRGPVARPLKDGDPETARENLMRLHGIFGDRLYIEIHTNALEDQVKVNQGLMDLADTYGIAPLAAVDSHYSVPEHKIIHKAWLAMQTGKTLTEDTSLFQGDQDYHLKDVAEVRASLAYLPTEFVEEAIANTVRVARLCTAKVGGQVTTPTYSKASTEHPDPVQRDVERLVELCLSNWERKVVGKRRSQEEYMARFEREMALLISKGFCGYFLIVWDYVAWAKSQGCLVGPGRGSGGGSLVAYLADIVEIDPVDRDLIFERFLTEGRTSLPDFDIDFPSSWRSRIVGYIISRWGQDFVSNIGTVSRLRSKQAINDTVRVLTGTVQVPDFRETEALKKAVEEADRPLAGKHLPWEEFCAQYADLVDPMVASYPEVFSVVDVVMDRVKTYGKHAAGVVISTDAPLTDLPMRLVEDKKSKSWLMVTQFDMNALELLGYVKFDILTLRTLDTLQEAVDLVAAKFGRKINPYDWQDEYEDPQVWEEVAAGKTLGLFQVETADGTRLTKRMQPGNLYDLAAVMTIVRPGPKRSGLTEHYLRRRAGLEAVTYPDHRLESFLGDTYGAMIYQEQVMATCMELAGYDSTEADTVRKLLGKKQVEKVQAAGEEFTRRAVECGTDPQVATELWEGMAEFAKYGFNKAHAFAYAVVGYWCAWLKFHFPVEFLLAAMSTVDTDRLPEFINECRNTGYGVIPPDINRSRVYFSAEGMDVIYGLSLVKGIGVETAEQIVRSQPYTSLEDFIERAVKPAGSAVNMGHVKTLVSVGAFDSLVENRKAVEIQLEREASGAAKQCVYKIEQPNPQHPFNLPCHFDWANEPDPPMLTRGRGKAKVKVPKEPPKKCTVACRQYQRPSAIAADEVSPYTREEIMLRERELLGVWITSTPFDQCDPQYLQMSHTASEIESGVLGETFTGICVVEGARKRKDVNGNEYAFVTLNMQDGSVEAICFASLWSRVGNYIRTDALGVAQVTKNARGFNLYDYSPI